MMLDRTAHKPPKCYMDCEQDVVDWIYEPLSEADRVRIFANKAKSLDCTIMDLADDIAYGVHDLEDAISLGLVSTERSDEHTSELQSLMRISYADFCLQKKKLKTQ